jgi:hemolysin III
MTAKDPEEEFIKERLVVYTEGEELANRITVGAGALMSVIGLVALVRITALQGDPWRVASCSLYGATLVLFYIISTLYHSVRRPRLRYVFRILDHASIFLIIAGTYTPFTLVSLQGVWGWSLFGVVWGLAFAGVGFKVVMTARLRILGPLLYLAMGWLIVIAYEPLVAAVPGAGIDWLIAGGLFYSGGLIFYAWDRLPFNHAIWHGFVLAGSACHYVAIYRYVAPA